MLIRFRRGDAEAANHLLPLVYDALRQQAGAVFQHERHHHTLQPTALVHEVFLRLFGNEKIDWQDRQHFFILAAHQMRRLLVDHARAKQAAKRDGHRQRVALTDPAALAQPTPSNPVDVLALDQALERLAAEDARAAQIVELRYFGGMTESEAAQALGISVSTLKRDWELARIWLFRQLKPR